MLSQLVTYPNKTNVLLKGNFGWTRPMFAGPRIDQVVIRDAWSMWAECSRIDWIVIREVQYQLEVNRCRNKDVNIKIPNSVLCTFQRSSTYSVGGDSGQDGRTDSGDHYNIHTLLKAWG
ncbi:hypothetical protein DPMN_140586 [Dreissena polymorpha]|uniref:Uncharacterized protein n=1 Tax=Dreissena polymorpha TaxID=45954 RepID=A0A9D4GDT1_DREPO|nr:hypothetical protein DPMN_140586 [Dreissena polymorpha]